MPGTIQVTVMDFMGPQSSSHTSQICVKVSMGKREYQSWDSRDFSFPLTTLRENLVVALKDSDGNEISRAVISIRTVVEKGLWDDIFRLEEGAQVHLKLQFVLTEEELDKIRMMRQSALKKKCGELLKSTVQSPESTTSAGSDVASNLYLNSRFPVNRKANQAGQASNRIGFSGNEKSITENADKASEDQKQPAPSDKGKGEEATLYGPKSQLTNVHLTEVRDISSGAASSPRNSEPVIVPKKYPAPVTLEKERINNSLKESPLEKSLNNVKKMISAFEGGVAQDMSPFTKPPPTDLQWSKIGREGYLKDQVSEKSNTDNSRLAESVSGRDINPLSEIKSPPAPKSMRRQGDLADLSKGTYKTKPSDNQQLESSVKRFQETLAHLENTFEVSYKERNTKEGNTLEDMEGTSTVGPDATVSGRILNKNYDRRGHDNFICNEKLPSQDHNDEKGRMVHLNELKEKLQRTSNNIPKSVGDSDDKYNGNSCTQIFPEAGRRFCVTTGDKRVMDLMTRCNIEAKDNQGALKENMRHDGNIDDNGQKTIHEARRSSTEIPEVDVGTSEGPIRQAVKIAIMIGFGTLVLLTRQRQSRYIYNLLTSSSLLHSSTLEEKDKQNNLEFV